jgi:hypothetical protein
MPLSLFPLPGAADALELVAGRGALVDDPEPGVRDEEAVGAAPGEADGAAVAETGAAIIAEEDGVAVADAETAAVGGTAAVAVAEAGGWAGSGMIGGKSASAACPDG